jgi:hypothetical protein
MKTPEQLTPSLIPPLGTLLSLDELLNEKGLKLRILLPSVLFSLALEFPLFLLIFLPPAADLPPEACCFPLPPPLTPLPPWPPWWDRNASGSWAEKFCSRNEGEDSSSLRVCIVAFVQAAEDDDGE